MSTHSSVYCTFTHVGFHYWEKAAEVLPKRAYLADRHRHLFHYYVEVPVTHDDRQVEFHELRDYCASLLPADGEFGGKSCETLATEMIVWVRKRWSHLAYVMVRVSEDDEAGATVTDVLE